MKNEKFIRIISSGIEGIITGHSDLNYRGNLKKIYVDVDHFLPYMVNNYVLKNKNQFQLLWTKGSVDVKVINV